MSEPTTAADPAAWIGRERRVADTLDAERARAMQAALDRAPTLARGDPLPPAWHWLYFWDPAPASALGGDGHPAPGGFLPPVDLPRRMWAGGRLVFHRPLFLGSAAQRSSTVQDVREKRGRSGRLVFVTVRHELADGDGPAWIEEQDLVYRGADHRASAPPRVSAAPGAWQRAVTCDPVLLFRYSALTFNGHRIHYDRAYARETEGYGDLVVHGPLLATLLLELLVREAGWDPPAGFRFRATAPLLVGEPASLNARADGAGGAELWVAGPDGRQCMTAAAHAGTAPLTMS
jgi:3-methylfumaryl-CoA hydratase